MKKITLIIFLLVTTNYFAQQTDSTLIQETHELNTKVSQQQQEIKTLKNSISAQELRFDKQEKAIENLQKQVSKQHSSLVLQKESFVGLKHENKIQKTKIDSLNQNIQTNSQNIDSNSKKLGSKIEQTEKSIIANNSKITALDDSLSKNQFYWIIAILIILFLSGFLYWFMGKRLRSNKNEVENKIQSNKTDMETQIKNTEKDIENKVNKLDKKLVEVYAKQLNIFDELVKDLNKSKEEEKDHSLVLKVADEVTKILMSLEVMDKNIRGYNHLKQYSQSILDNLKAYGYEIPQLIGQKYNSGMNMVATLEFDDSIEEGKQIIKRITRPQVNFDKKMIQAAKVIVAFNE